jgi:molybdenum transport protein
MEYSGGMATATAALVSAARQGRADVNVACTRKHMPGTRALSLKAILCGGASPHRLGISDSVLVFAEHRAFLGDLAPSAAIARLKQAWPDRKLLVEVDKAADAYLWIAAGADVIQLDKCAPAEVAQVCAHAAQQARPPLIAAAGGITPHNAHSFAQSGAHILVTSHPYQAAPKDVAVTIQASA